MPLVMLFFKIMLPAATDYRPTKLSAELSNEEYNKNTVSKNWKDWAAKIRVQLLEKSGFVNYELKKSKIK